MANYIILKLDVTSPASPSISIASGATYTGDQEVTCAISTSDSPTTGYQMLIWGDVDESDNANIQATSGDSTWITFTSSIDLKLSSGDGSKTINLKIRDDVYNESSSTSDSIYLDTTLPVVTTSAPDVSKVSKIFTKNTASFNFTSDSDFSEYKVKIVASTSSLESSGILIGTVHGSTNMSGTGSFDAETPINCTITGGDLEVAGAVEGDDGNIIKVFVKELGSGVWST